MKRHLKALPALRGLWRAWPDEAPRWIVPADKDAEACGVPYLFLKPGDPTFRLHAVTQ